MAQMSKPKPRAALRLALALAAIAAVAASQAQSHPPDGVVVREVLRRATTTSGQPLSLPQGPVETIVSRYAIAPGAALPVHKHPYPRIGYVLSGRLEVTAFEGDQARVFETGEAIIEDIGRWHSARNLGSGPVELLVIDLAPPGAITTVLPH